MARPPGTYGELLNLAKEAPVGTTVLGARLETRVSGDRPTRFDLTVSKGPETWLIKLLVNSDDVGRIVTIIDGDGRIWGVSSILDGFVEGEIGGGG